MPGAIYRTAVMIVQLLSSVPSQPGPAVTSWPLTVLQAVASGVLVAGVMTLLRATWVRCRVPTALARKVRRRTYLGAVLAESRRDQVTTLDVLAPRLSPALDNRMIAAIQAAWKKINQRGRVRVLTLDSRECLEGGLELFRDGIQVRISHRDLESEDLSYHVFGTLRKAGTAVVNHHYGNAERPMRLEGKDPIKVFHKHFESIWKVASPLEAVVAEKITELACGQREPAEVMRTASESGLDLSTCLDKLRPHLAFRNSSSVIFIVGLPGSGKSRVRRLLAERLDGMGIQAHELTDYLYAFRDFLQGQIKLEPYRHGFEACPGGAFAVRNEAALTPALWALDAAVRDSLKESEVTIAEFARTALTSALDQFDDIRTRCRVIYVQAPAQLRSARLRSRVEPPEITVGAGSVTVTPSDNHQLPSTVECSLYENDDIDQLERSPRWRGRILRIDNDVDDGGAKIGAKIDEFIAGVNAPYSYLPGAPLQ